MLEIKLQMLLNINLECNKDFPLPMFLQEEFWRGYRSWKKMIFKIVVRIVTLPKNT